MMQKYGQMANEIVNDQPPCLICGEVAGFNWADLWGEAMCNRCGAPYSLLRNDVNGNVVSCDPPHLKLKSTWIPVFQQYWQETHAYMGLGTILIGADYPECIEGRGKLDNWLKAHPELIPKDN